MRFNQTQKEKISDILSDLSKIILGAIVVGQFFPNASYEFQPWLKWFGIGFSFAILCLSIILLKSKE